MTNNKKLAIVNNNQDLLRIIPFNADESIEFKFATRENEFKLKYWHLGLNKPEEYNVNTEITYHKSVIEKNQKKEPIIHVKDINGNSIYKHRFKKIRNLRLDSVFPIPLCKIAISNNVETRYKQKNEHYIFDFNNFDGQKINCVEIYITSKEYDINFMNHWPNWDIIWQINTIDYLVGGTNINEKFIEQLKSGPKICREMTTFFDDFNLIFKVYNDEKIKCNEISFYENMHYISMIATNPVQLVDDITKRPLSQIKPAYFFDLEWKSKKGIPISTIKKWKRFYRQLEKEIKYINIKRVIYLIPQDSTII